MSDLVKMVRDASVNTGKTAFHVSKGVLIGAIQGAYSPLMVYTWVNKLITLENNVDYGAYSESKKTEMAWQVLAQGIATPSSFIAGAFFASSHGRGKEYVAALAVANAIDIGLHLYKSIRHSSANGNSHTA